MSAQAIRRSKRKTKAELDAAIERIESDRPRMKLCADRISLESAIGQRLLASSLIRSELYMRFESGFVVLSAESEDYDEVSIGEYYGPWYLYEVKQLVDVGVMTRSDANDYARATRAWSRRYQRAWRERDRLGR